MEQLPPIQDLPGACSFLLVEIEDMRPCLGLDQKQQKKKKSHQTSRRQIGLKLMFERCAPTKACLQSFSCAARSTVQCWEAMTVKASPAQKSRGKKKPRPVKARIFFYKESIASLVSAAHASHRGVCQVGVRVAKHTTKQQGLA